MSEQMQKELLARLDALAQKMGVAGHALWEMYVRQSYLNGLQTAFISLLALTVAIVASYVSVKVHGAAMSAYKAEDIVWQEKMKGDSSYYSPYSAPGLDCWFLIPAVVALIALCVAGSYAQDSMNYLLNPQLQAFQSIIQAVK